jgi:hypothetical protein
MTRLPEPDDEFDLSADRRARDREASETAANPLNDSDSADSSADSDGLGDDIGDNEDDTTKMRAAIEAFFAEPFPEKPYALVPAGGENGREYQDYIIHKDIDTERQCVIIFDSIVDAFAVAEEYKQATGREAEPVECDVNQLEDRFYLKFYRSNGLVAILSLDDYKDHVGGTFSPYED